MAEFHAYHAAHTSSAQFAEPAPPEGSHFLVPEGVIDILIPPPSSTEFTQVAVVCERVVYTGVLVALEEPGHYSLMQQHTILRETFDEAIEESDGERPDKPIQGVERDDEPRPCGVDGCRDVAAGVVTLFGKPYRALCNRHGDYLRESLDSTPAVRERALEWAKAVHELKRGQTLPTPTLVWLIYG